MKFLIISLFFLSSCSGEHPLTKNRNTLMLKKFNAKIVDIAEVDWKVGKKRDKNISKGLKVQVVAPKIDEAGRRELKKMYKVDSWIYRVTRKNKGREATLGYMTTDLSNTGKGDKKFGINIFYQAAAVSQNFRMFHCPAFSHRYKLTDFKINTSKPRLNEIYTQTYPRIKANISTVRFAPIIVPAGLSLNGQYYVDMAFYNSHSKQRFSRWYRLENNVSITREVKVHLPSCVGIKEELRPLKESRTPTLKDLQIK